MRSLFLVVVLSLTDWTPFWSTTTPRQVAVALLPPLTKTADHLPLAQKAMQYFDAGSDPFHAVQASIDLLQQAGFEEIVDCDPFQGKLVPGGKYYFTRNRSTLVAFSVGGQYQVGNGFKIIGGHTDSPNLRVKPRSKRSAAGCIQLGVECYGGGLWHTWFDRDLGISGRVLVRTRPTSTTSGENNGNELSDDDNDDDDFYRIEQRLVKIDRAVLRIPNLAIHLQTAKEREAFEYNKEDHLSPILALEAQAALTTGSAGGSSNAAPTEENGDKATPSTSVNPKRAVIKDGWTEHQEPALLQLLAHELNVKVADIVDFELNLFDVQKAALGGVFSEFVHSARLDNLASCYMAVQALVDHVVEQDGQKLANDPGIAMIVLYDHEEVGSGSAVGAASPIMGESVRRIAAALCHPTNDQNAAAAATATINNMHDIDPDVYHTCIQRSFVLSSDQAHAVHPNYVAKHEKNHQPVMNRGMVIKRNSNQRYATNVVTGVLMREIARRAGLPPVQEFLVRQDCGCGSTIGPVISQATGIRTIDMGCPQLSMHSIRETMGVCDLTNGLALFKAYFELFHKVDASVGK